jgi:hypothetical protein
MNVVRVKPGVEFTVIAPGGFCILSAIQRATSEVGVDLWITSACDGEHSGPSDPHHSGNAFDVRSHDLPSEIKQKVLDCVNGILGVQAFYGFLESPDTDNEHFHFQIKKGTVYP